VQVLARYARAMDRTTAPAKAGFLPAQHGGNEFFVDSAWWSHTTNLAPYPTVTVTTGGFSNVEVGDEVSIYQNGYLGAFRCVRKGTIGPTTGVTTVLPRAEGGLLSVIQNGTSVQYRVPFLFEPLSGRSAALPAPTLASVSLRVCGGDTVNVAKGVVGGSLEIRSQAELTKALGFAGTYTMRHTYYENRVSDRPVRLAGYDPATMNPHNVFAYGGALDGVLTVTGGTVFMEDCVLPQSMIVVVGRMIAKNVVSSPSYVESRLSAIEVRNMHTRAGLGATTSTSRGIFTVADGVLRIRGSKLAASAPVVDLARGDVRVVGSYLQNLVPLNTSSFREQVSLAMCNRAIGQGTVSLDGCGLYRKFGVTRATADMRNVRSRIAVRMNSLHELGTTISSGTQDIYTSNLAYHIASASEMPDLPYSYYMEFESEDPVVAKRTSIARATHYIEFRFRNTTVRNLTVEVDYLMPVAVRAGATAQMEAWIPHPSGGVSKVEDPMTYALSNSAETNIVSVSKPVTDWVRPSGTWYAFTRQFDITDCPVGEIVVRLITTNMYLTYVNPIWRVL